MPQQPASQRDTQQQQAAQAGVTAAMVAALAAAWALIDIGDLAGTLPRYEVAVTALVHRYGLASGTLAARFYQQQRGHAAVPGRFPVMPADPPGPGQVSKSLGWATKGLWNQNPDIAAAKSLANGVAQKLVVDTGRNTLIAAIEADKECRGWAREARPSACAFCALLSTRGAVYKSERSASKTKAGADYHDHCHCVPVPVFSDFYEPPAHVRQWGALYRATPYGGSAAAARNNFRVALEQSRSPQPEHAHV